MTTSRHYLKPPWMQRQIANRLVPLFKPDVVSRLSVKGRRSRRWHTVPVAVLDYEDSRYLISYRGESDWVRNLRASQAARLQTKSGVEDIEVVEVPVNERAPLLEVYRERYGKMPTVSGVLDALPDAADHPTFLITDSRSGTSRDLDQS
jgi:deazaflavin-dependent oxidoreductase (nitroreductase family)